MIMFKYTNSKNRIGVFVLIRNYLSLGSTIGAEPGADGCEPFPPPSGTFAEHFLLEHG